MELLVSWKCVGVKFVISCGGKKTLNNTLKLSKIFNLRIYGFIGKDPCLASIYGISRLSVLRYEVCFFLRWGEICYKNISTSFWLGKKNPKHQNMSKKMEKHPDPSGLWC